MTGIVDELIAAAKKQARKEGEKRGIKRGEIRGAKKAKLEIAKNLLKNTRLPIEEICKITGLLPSDLKFSLAKLSAR